MFKANFLFQGPAVIEANNGPTMWIGLGFLAITLGWVVWMKYQSPDDTLGDIFGKLLFREKFTIFLGLTFLINIGEGVMAASIHPVGQMPVNELARILTHLSISLVSIVSAMWAARLLFDVFTAPKDEERSKYWLRWCAFGITTFAAVFLPYLNLIIISGGLQETHHLQALLRGEGAVAYNNMSYVMQASCGASVAHYLLITIDAIYTLYVDQGGDTTLNVNERINNRSRKEQQEALDNFEDHVRYLLVRYSYKNNKLANKISTAKNKYDAMGKTAHKVSLAFKCAELVVQIKKWDSEQAHKLSGDEKKAAKKRFLKKIFELFKASPNGGKGFGMQLGAPPKQN